MRRCIESKAPVRFSTPPKGIGLFLLTISFYDTTFIFFAPKEGLRKNEMVRSEALAGALETVGRRSPIPFGGVEQGKHYGVEHRLTALLFEDESEAVRR